MCLKEICVSVKLALICFQCANLVMLGYISEIIPFLVYFSLGWATREILVFGLENKGEVELLSIHILVKI